MLIVDANIILRIILNDNAEMVKDVDGEVVYTFDKKLNKLLSNTNEN